MHGLSHVDWLGAAIGLVLLAGCLLLIFIKLLGIARRLTIRLILLAGVAYLTFTIFVSSGHSLL